MSSLVPWYALPTWKEIHCMVTGMNEWAWSQAIKWIILRLIYLYSVPAKSCTNIILYGSMVEHQNALVFRLQRNIAESPHGSSARIRSLFFRPRRQSAVYHQDQISPQHPVFWAADGHRWLRHSIDKTCVERFCSALYAGKIATKPDYQLTMSPDTAFHNWPDHRTTPVISCDQPSLHCSRRPNSAWPRSLFFRPCS